MTCAAALALVSIGCSDAVGPERDHAPDIHQRVAAPWSGGFDVELGSRPPRAAIERGPVRASAPSSAFTLTRTLFETTVLATFEGLGNQAAVPTIGHATYAGWESDRRITSTCNTNTIPKCSGSGAYSGDVAIFWHTGPALNTRDITFSRPVGSLSLRYSACIACYNEIETVTASLEGRDPVLLPEKITITAYNAAGAVIDAVEVGDNNAPGQTTYMAWDLVEVASDENGTDNLITRVRVTGRANFVGIDDVFYRIVNFAPVAKAALTSTPVEGSPVTFTAVLAADPSYDPVDKAGTRHANGDPIASYSWNFGDGSPAKTGSSVAHTFPNSGSFWVHLTVTDPNGAAKSDSLQVTVANAAPVVTAAVSSTIPAGTTIGSPGSFSDRVDDSPWGYSIAWGDGSPVDTGSVNVQGVIAQGHTYTRAGTFTVQLRVTDRDGGQGSGSFTVTVTNGTPSAALVTPSGAVEGVAVAFDASGSTEPDGQTLHYAWDFGDGNTLAAAPGQAQPSHTYGDNGSYSVRVIVSDPFGAADTASATLVVANAAPSATFVAPTGVDEGTGFSLSLTGASDVAADAGTLTYAFDCGSGFGPVTASATAACPASNDGTRSVAGKVIDKDGGLATYSGTVAVTNIAPVVNAGADVSGTEGEQLSIAPSFTDPGPDAPWSVVIAWGDGSADTITVNSPGAVPASHTYTSAGSFTVTVTVSDDDTSATDQLVADIEAAAPEVIEVSIKVTPQALKLSSGNDKGDNRYMRAELIFADGLTADQLVPGSFTLGNGDGNDVAMVDVRYSGPRKATFTFLRSDLIANGEFTPPQTTLVLTGELLDGRVVRGSDTIKVKP